MIWGFWFKIFDLGLLTFDFRLSTSELSTSELSTLDF